MKFRFTRGSFKNIHMHTLRIECFKTLLTLWLWPILLAPIGVMSSAIKLLLTTHLWTALNSLKGTPPSADGQFSQLGLVHLVRRKEFQTEKRNNSFVHRDLNSSLNANCLLQNCIKNLAQFTLDVAYAKMFTTISILLHKNEIP